MATVQDLIDQTREIMNATSSTQWSDTTLRSWCSMAMWQLWANILNANRYWKMQQVSVAQDSSGRIALSSLNTGSGDSKKYLYRILTVANPQVASGASSAAVQFFYRQSRYEDFPNPQPNTSLPYIWYQIGAEIQIMPIAAGQTMTITTNYRPPNCNQLAGTSSTVDFPDGYEALIPWRACQLALLKGGSETRAALDLQRKADEMENQMLMDLGRLGKWPTVAESFDLPADWGSSVGT